MYSIKLVDREAIISASKTGHIIVAQDHNVYGELGSIVAEEGLTTKLKILGKNDIFVAIAHTGYLYHQFGVDGKGLRKNMLEKLN